MDLSIQVQIIALWAVFLFGMVFHSQLAMMPMLYGQDVAMPGSSGKMPVSHLWLMLGFYAIPMVAIAATAVTAAPLYRMIHFGLTVVYTVMNFTHAAMDLGVKPIEWYQIALMVIVFINGILLNIVAFQWMQ
ncbi:MAG: hypothetical protein OHK0047_27470 [Leptolyngbyaceae cyanobacterium]|uniref:hypothetical protein n=1 Tax=Leptodesmis sp. TaxID=3100501 RepID=UPI003D0E542E